jgi:hypothetical protein
MAEHYGTAVIPARVRKQVTEVKHMSKKAEAEAEANGCKSLKKACMLTKQ